MLKIAIPVLHVSSSVAAEEFYSKQLGFIQDFAYRPFGKLDPCYMGFSRDEARFHVLTSLVEKIFRLSQLASRTP